MIQHDPQKELALEREAQFQEDKRIAVQHEHELALVKLQTKTASRQSIWTTAFKAPAYGIALFVIMVLSLAGKPIPDSINRFLAS